MSDQSCLAATNPEAFTINISQDNELYFFMADIDILWSEYHASLKYIRRKAPNLDTQIGLSSTCPIERLNISNKIHQRPTLCFLEL